MPDDNYDEIVPDTLVPDTPGGMAALLEAERQLEEEKMARLGRGVIEGRGGRVHVVRKGEIPLGMNALGGNFTKGSFNPAGMTTGQAMDEAVANSLETPRVTNRGLEQKIAAEIRKQRAETMTATEAIGAHGLGELAHLLQQRIEDVYPEQETNAAGPRNWRRAGDLVISVGGPTGCVVIVDLAAGRISLAGEVTGLSPDKARWLATRLADAAGYLQVDAEANQDPPEDVPF